jgi:hypothetical protein
MAIKKPGFMYFGKIVQFTRSAMEDGAASLSVFFIQPMEENNIKLYSCQSDCNNGSQVMKTEIPFPPPAK